MQTSYDENGGATSDTEYWLYLITYFLNNKYYCDENKNVKNVKMCFYIISMITPININNIVEPFTYDFLFRIYDSSSWYLKLSQSIC